jgi:hypothetical protein
VVGALSLAFMRSFRAGHWRAELDGIWVLPGQASLLDALVAVAVEQAARRHCRELRATGPLGSDLAAALGRHGAATIDGRSLALSPAAAAPARRRRRRQA